MPSPPWSTCKSALYDFVTERQGTEEILLQIDSIAINVYRSLVTCTGSKIKPYLYKPVFLIKKNAWRKYIPGLSSF